MREVPKSRVLVQVFMIRDSLFSLAGWCEPYALGEASKRGTHLQPAQDLDIGLFSILVYPLRSKGKDGHSAAAKNCFWVNYIVIIQVTISCVYYLNKQLHALSSALYQKFATFTVLLTFCFFL